MDLYKYLNFFVFLFLAFVFLFVYLLTVRIAFKVRLYRTVRRIFESKVEFWDNGEALRRVKRHFLRSDN